MDKFQLSGFSASNMMYCTVDGPDIVQVDFLGNRKIIGKTQAAYEELEETTSQYYDKLVELKVIVPEKTPEQMMSEMQGTMIEMSKIIQSLSTKVKELKEHGSEQCTCSCGEDVPERKPKRGSAKSAGDDKPNPEQP